MILNPDLQCAGWDCPFGAGPVRVASESFCRGMALCCFVFRPFKAFLILWIRLRGPWFGVKILREVPGKSRQRRKVSFPHINISSCSRHSTDGYGPKADTSCIHPCTQPLPAEGGIEHIRLILNKNDGDCLPCCCCC